MKRINGARKLSSLFVCWIFWVNSFLLAVKIYEISQSWGTIQVMCSVNKIITYLNIIFLYVREHPDTPRQKKTPIFTQGNWMFPKNNHISFNFEQIFFEDFDRAICRNHDTLSLSSYVRSTSSWLNLFWKLNLWDLDFLWLREYIEHRKCWNNIKKLFIDIYFEELF